LERRCHIKAFLLAFTALTREPDHVLSTTLAYGIILDRQPLLG
jgi:hypothetical protein